jgi:arginine repressor
MPKQRQARASNPQPEEVGKLDARRRLVVDLLRREVITSVKELAAAIQRETGRPAPHPRTLQEDLEKVGVVRVNLGGGIWRYRTADLLTLDDAKLGVQDRLASDGIAADLWSEGVVIITTKGTAAATATLFKMMKDYDLDQNIRWVMHDGDDTILMSVYPAEARRAYLTTIRQWMGARL